LKPGKELLFLALGGSAEIGMNVNLYGCDGKWVMVDLGMTFSDPHYPGIELVLPDLEFIERHKADLLGVVLTHGHEDHIGAVPYLAAELGVPLFATPFTAGLVRHKLAEHGLTDRVELRIIENGGSLKLGSFDFTYMPLAHSIAEGNALVIDTPYGRIFHTGDWKLDDEPLVGVPSTPEALSAVGDGRVLAMVCDSTNVFNDESAGSEAMVRANLLEEIAPLTGRVMVTTFASNAARLDTLGKVARATNRQLCVAGRSLDRMLQNGQATGYFRDFPDTIDFETAMRLPGNEVLIIATGGQGEPRAALARVANGQHQIKLAEGDTVLFSSKVIPGNDISIGIIQNQLASMGVNMITDRQADIHVSGHPGRPDLKQMYEWIRPEILVPVHGEMRHMAEQARFALECGVPKSILQRNGDVVRLAPKGPECVGKERTGRLVLDGQVILPADGATMGERRRIAVNGQISVAVAIDEEESLAGSPVIRMQGVPVEADRDAFIDEMTADIEAAYDAWTDGIDDLREKIRLAVRRCANRWTGKKPIIDVLIVEI
jgi:ribonuclease J